jgi:hypothetical protein
MVRLVSIVAACMTLLAAGCSSTPVQQTASDNADSCDRVQMARIERSAQQERAQLRWVHCPQAHTTHPT